MPKQRLIMSGNQLRMLVERLVAESSGGGAKREFYHVTHQAHLDSFKRGIDPNRAKGSVMDQGPGFYVWSNRSKALDHVQAFAAGSVEKKDERFPDDDPSKLMIVVIEEELTPENFDVDLEAAADHTEDLDLHLWIATKLHGGDGRMREILDGMVAAGLNSRWELRRNGPKSTRFGLPGDPKRFYTPNRHDNHLRAVVPLARWMEKTHPDVWREYELEVLGAMYDHPSGAFRWHGSKRLMPTRMEDASGRVLWRG